MLPITTTKTPRPPRIFLYGPAGIGKTTLVSSFPGVLVLPVEEGADALDVPRLPRPTTWDEAISLVDAVANEPSGHRALAIDSVTALQQMCIVKVCQNYNAKSIEEIGGGWGKGWRPAHDLWMNFLDRLEVVRSRGMAILMVGHLEVRPYNDPRLSAYDRFQPRLHKELLASTIERCDALLCANYKVFTESEEKGFNKTRARGIGSGVRVLHCTEQPTHLAKNRYSLPDELPMEWAGVLAGISAAFAPTVAAPVTSAPVITTAASAA